MQSKRHSIVESLTNTFVGLFLSLGISQLFWEFEIPIQRYIWAGFEWHINTASNIYVTIVLTIVSILRGYVLRRWFNKKIVRQYRTAKSTSKIDLSEGVKRGERTY